MDLSQNNKRIHLIKNDKNIITIYIESSDQTLNCKIRCNSSDKFNEIVNKILEKKPEFTEKIGYFLCNGDKINEYKSLKDNGIEDGNDILLTITD